MRSLSASITAEIAKDIAIPRTLFRLFLDGGTLYFTDHTSDITFQGHVYASAVINHGPIKTYMQNRVDSCEITIDNVDQAMSAYYAYEDFEGRKADIWKVFLADATCKTNGAVLKSAATIPYDTLSGIYPAAGTAYINGEPFTYTGNTGVAFTGCSARLNDSADDSPISGSYSIDGSPGADDKIVQFRGNMDMPKVNENTFTVRIVSMFDRSQSNFPWRKYQERCNWDYCEADCSRRGGLGVLTGTATSGALGTLTDTAIPSDAYNVDDYWKGARIKIIAGAAEGDIRLVSGYDSATKTFAVYENFSEAIDATSEYVLECDKSRSVCTGFGNFSHFGGYDEQIYYRNRYVGRPALWYRANTWKKDISATDQFIPLVYGRASIAGVLLDESIEGVFELWSTGSIGHRLYGICEGEISEIEAFSVNGVLAWENGVSKYPTFHYALYSFDMVYTPLLGAAGQSLSFRGETKYYPKTAFAQVSLIFGAGHNYWNLEGITNDTPLQTDLDFYNIDYRHDSVVFTVKGLIVQKYLADGTPDGAPAWSDNPSWCLLDFLMNRAKNPIAAADIDFFYWLSAATTCDTLGYRCNMVLMEEKSDTDVIDQFLTTCHGFLSYPAGKMALNIETVWSGPAAHSFGDAATIADNIKGFDYGKKAVNDIFNQVTVKYPDEQVRPNMALVDGYLDKSVTTIPYGDLKGTFTSSGTIYINGEPITYTSKDATHLYGCSARSKDYPSGYPLFQGQQTFPILTATYNDLEHQRKVKRVIPKELDGSGIPTYSQAYAIAEWYCRKSVRGSQFCSLTGFMDSLHLTVGDVVSITHDLPGWVAQLFRVIAASETKDEEVAYEFERYDPTFYTANSATPSARIATTLPNPHALSENVTSLALTEGGYADAGGAYIPTLLLTYNLPTDPVFWGWAIIQVKVNAGDYVNYGTDQSGGRGFSIDGIAAGFKPGDTVTVRVISVNRSGAYGDDLSAPTVAHTLTGAVVDPTTPTGLALEGGGTTWNGLKFAVLWDPPAAGAEPSYIFAEVEVWTGGVKRATFGPIKENRWDYVYGDGIAAFLDNYVVAANGAVTIKVCKKNVYGSASSQATLAITQAAPTNPQNAVIQALPRGASLTWDKNQETDFKEYQVRTKITSGGSWSSFAPIAENSYTRMLTAAEIAASGKTPDIYFEVKTIDLFGNASSATAANVAAIYYGITTLDVDELSADLINVGSLRGINVQAGSFMTKGSYLTAAISANLLNANQENVETNTTGFTGTNATLTRDTSTFKAGAASLRIVTPGAGLSVAAINGSQIYGAYTTAWACAYGATRTFAAWIYSDGTCDVKLRVVELDNAGNVLATNLSTEHTAAASWNRIRMVFTPSNASCVGVMIYIYNSSEVAGTMYADGMQWASGDISSDPTILEVKDTTDFASSGSGWIIDTTNDRDAIAWTGKTATALTGCSGVLAHNNGAVIIPKAQSIIIDNAVNELRFFGAAAAGVTEELGSIGLANYMATAVIASFGSQTSGNGKIGVQGYSDTNAGISGTSVSGFGVWGFCDAGSTTPGSGSCGVGGKGYFGLYGKAKTFESGAYGIYADGSAGTGGYFKGAQGAFQLGNTGSASAPSHSAEHGTFCMTTNGVVYVNTSSPSPGTTWQKVGAQ